MSIEGDMTRESTEIPDHEDRNDLEELDDGLVDPNCIGILEDHFQFSPVRKLLTPAYSCGGQAVGPVNLPL